MRAQSPKIIKKISCLLMALAFLTNSIPSANAMPRLVFTNDVFKNDADIFRIGDDKNAATDTLSLQFGGTNTKSISWDTTKFNISNTTAIAGGLSATGQVNFSAAAGFRMREDPNPAANAACATAGELILDTTDNEIQTCTAPGAAGFAGWVGFTATNTSTLDGLDSTQFLRSDTSDNFTSGTLTFDAGTTLTANGTLGANGVVALGDGGDTVSINSSVWDITTTGVVSGLAGITSAGGAVSLNNNSNFATDINTGTSSGAVTIGGGSSPVAVNSTSWDITTGGVASGFNGITSTGVVDFSSASRMALQQGAANPLTCAKGDIFYNTTNDTTYVCTATNVFSALSVGNPDFEAVYAADGDKTLTTSNGAFTIEAGTGAVNVNSTTGGISLNNNVNGDVNIATGTSTGTVTLGGTGTQTIAVGSGGGAKTVNLGSSLSTSTTTILSGTGGLELNANNNQITNINTGTSTGTVNVGTGATAQNISIGTGAGNKTVGLGSSSGTSSTTILSGSLGVNINDSNDVPTNINTGTSAGAVGIGGGLGTVAIDSSVWDITSAGVASGFTGITSANGAISLNDNSGASTTSIGGGTTTGAVYIGIGAGTQYIDIGDGPGAKTVDLGSNASTSTTNLLSGSGGLHLNTNNSSTTSINAGTSSGTVNMGTGSGNIIMGNAVGTTDITTSTWNINSSGVASGLTGLSSSGTVNFTQGINVTGGAANLNTNSNFATNINTGTSTGTVNVGTGTSTQAINLGNGAGPKTVNLGSSTDGSTTSILSGTGGVNLNMNNNQPTSINTGISTGAVSVGGGSGTVAIDSSVWDITSAGVGSGFTGLTSTGTVNFSGSTNFRLHEAASDPGTCTVGQQYFNTTTKTLRSCTSTNVWTSSTTGTNYTFIYDTNTQTLSVANAFQDITLGTNGQLNGWTHTAGSADITAAVSGLYLVTYNYSADATGGGGNAAPFEVRALFNGTEVAGSQTGFDLAANNVTYQSGGGFLLSATASQILKFQFTGTDTRFRLTPAGAQATTRASIGVSIVRIN